MRYCSVSSFDLDLLYYVTMNARSREFGHSLSLHGNEYERRTPDVSGMTICASYIDPRVRTLQGLTTLYNLYVRSQTCRLFICD